MRLISALYAITLSLAMLAASGCTKEGGSGDSNTPDNDSIGGRPTSTEFRTECGVVMGGKLYNPVKPKDGDRAPARIVGPNLVAIKKGSREDLIKLHGLDVPGDLNQRNGAEALLERLSKEGDVYFYQVDKSCRTTLDNSTNGIVGQLFSSNGKSFSEELIKAGVADVGTDVCNGDLIGPCYRALLEDSITPTPTPAPEYSGPSTPAGFILWKPVSDSDGRLAVHSTPFGTTVVVKGETGRNRGPGNDYGSLARFSKNGCGYGKNVRLELILSDGSKFLFGSKPYATIPDGCSRFVVDQKGKVTANRK